jgi:hypothetical protein
LFRLFFLSKNLINTYVSPSHCSYSRFIVLRNMTWTYYKITRHVLIKPNCVFMFFHPMPSFVTLQANANRFTGWNEACCVLDHQAFGVKILQICICLFSTQCMKLTQNGKFITLRLFLVFFMLHHSTHFDYIPSDV